MVSLLRDSKEKYFKNLNPRKEEFWKAIKSLAHNTSEIPTLKSSDTVATTHEDKATMLSYTFCQNFNSSAPPLSYEDVIPMPRTPCVQIDPGLLCTEPEVFDLLTSLDISKATGPDGIYICPNA